jgi:hypothetical protein
MHLNAEDCCDLAVARYVIAHDGEPPADRAGGSPWSAAEWLDWAIRWLADHRELLVAALATPAPTPPASEQERIWRILRGR